MTDPIVGRVVHMPTTFGRPCKQCITRGEYVGDDQRRFLGLIWQCGGCDRQWTWKRHLGAGRSGPSYYWKPERTGHQIRREARARRRDARTTRQEQRAARRAENRSQTALG